MYFIRSITPQCRGIQGQRGAALNKLTPQELPSFA
jgi:hypothetical protein